MLRAFRFFVALFAAFPLWCNAAEFPSRCGTPPLVSEDQAICVASHHLRAKSELCSGETGFLFSAQATGSSWIVLVYPNDWKSRPECTGDSLEISQQTGQLMKWKTFKYHP